MCVCERKRTHDLGGVMWPNLRSAEAPIQRARRHKQVDAGVKLLILQDFLNQLNHPICTFYFINIVKPRPLAHTPPTQCHAQRLPRPSITGDQRPNAHEPPNRCSAEGASLSLFVAHARRLTPHSPLFHSRRR